MQKWIILIIVSIIVLVAVFVIFNVDIETEYIPEAEVEDVELRKTIVSLYFKDKTTQDVIKETRIIDSKELLRNPYKTLIDLLIEGPENTNYERIIPENAQVKNIIFENGCVNIDFSKEFSESVTPEILNTRISAIENTLMELTEVTNVNVLVEGEKIES